MDAASIGGLVVVAISGGAGALGGAVIGQVVQLRRDQKQHEREDARYERDRQQDLESHRAERREDKYVELLGQLNKLRHLLSLYGEVVEAYAGDRDLLETQLDEERRSFIASMIDNSGGLATDLQGRINEQKHELFRAVYEAYGVASEEVRDLGHQLTAKASLGFAHEQLTSPGRRLIIADGTRPRLGTHGEFVATLVADVEILQAEISVLDKRLRTELRLA